MNDLVSVIVPVFNVENCLEHCVDSIVNQTYKNIEIILVNDGSTDKSGNICDNWAKKDNRITVIHKINSGVSSARNEGLKIAKGKYIMFCDSDDYVSNKWIEQMTCLIENDGIDLGICDYQSVNYYDEHKVFDEDFNLGDYSVVEKSFSWDLYVDLKLNVPWNKIFNKKIIDNCSIKFDENLSMGEDLRFVLDYLSCCDNKLAVTNNNLYYYFYSEGSLTKSYINNFWEIKKSSFDNLKNKMLEFGVDEAKLNEEFYDIYLNGALECLNNNMKNGRASFIKKIRDNRDILKSKELETALKNCKKNKYNRLLIKVLGYKNSFLYYAFHRAHELKN